jgi:hypothetical protein
VLNSTVLLNGRRWLGSSSVDREVHPSNAVLLAVSSVAGDRLAYDLIFELAPNALLKQSPSTVPRSVISPCLQRKAWVDVSVSAWPTTSPSSLIEFATPLFPATSSCSYFTTRVSFVAWVNVVDPELNVPVTVRLYVPAGVPPVPLFPPPPPQEDKILAIRNKQANANPLSNRTGCLAAPSRPDSKQGQPR